MDRAPRDGTHILSILYFRSSNAVEWREVYWNAFDCLWYAGDTTQSYADDVPRAWLPLPNYPLCNQVGLWSSVAPSGTGE